MRLFKMTSFNPTIAFFVLCKMDSEQHPLPSIHSEEEAPKLKVPDYFRALQFPTKEFTTTLWIKKRLKVISKIFIYKLE